MGSINILILKDIVVNEIQEFINEFPGEFKGRVIQGSKEDFSFYISVYVPFRSGDLASHHVIVDTGDYDYFFDNEMMYYPFVILGTKPHSIDPLPPNEFLAFTASDGTFVITRHVDHPGTAPQDYMEMALDPGSDAVDPRLNDLADWAESAWG